MCRHSAGMHADILPWPSVREAGAGKLSGFNLEHDKLINRII